MTRTAPYFHHHLRCLLRLLAFGALFAFPIRTEAQLTVQGVYLDPEGVLRFRETGPTRPFRRDLRQDSSVCDISLPRLFAELRRINEASERIPESLLYLGGMVKLRSIHVDPENHDLIISGDAEPWNAQDPDRPRGVRTGRPVLRLDDLVVAFRHLGPGSRSRIFGCTLEQSPEAIGRVAALQPRITGQPAGNEARIAAAMKEAVGPLDAKFFGIPADTRISYVCVEADYLMKRLSLGLDRSPVPTVRSYLSLSTGKNMFNRFWFTAKYDPLRVSKDGRTFEIHGQGLQILASDSPTKQDTSNPAAQKFADSFTDGFPKLEQAIPAFADLHNIADIAVLVSLIAEDRLHEQAGWDPGWILNPDGYRPATVPVPKQAETLVNYLTKGRRTVTCVGGVQLDPRKLIKNRQTLDVESPPAIPEGTWTVSRRN